MAKKSKKRRFVWVLDFTEFLTPQDVKKTKVLSAVGYFLFFVPFVFHGDSQYARFHVNQSFLNLLMSTLGIVLLGMIPYIGPYLVLLQLALSLIWAVRGFILALQGKAKGIPLVGRLTIFAYRYPGQTYAPGDDYPEL